MKSNTTSNSHSSAATGRITGYDLARCLAVIGMVIVNFTVVMSIGSEGPDKNHLFTGLLEGRAAATFVILAGIGMSLMVKNALATENREKFNYSRKVLLKRSLFLFIVGMLYTPIWPADILHFYGLFIAVCVLFLNSSGRRLWISAVVFTAGFVLMMILFDYEQGWNWETLDYIDMYTVNGLIRHMFFNGFHPVFPWTAFMLAGIWLGRKNMNDPSFRRRLIYISILVVAGTETVSRYLISVFSEGITGPELEVITYLFGTGPMPPLPFYILSAGGTAFVVIAICVMIAEKFYGTGWLQPLISTGQLALTNYVAHVVIGMFLLDYFDLLHNQTVSFALVSALVFCSWAILFSYLWRRRFERGPLEWVMRKITG